MMAVFSGGFTLAAATAVYSRVRTGGGVSGKAEEQTAESSLKASIESLISKSLVRVQARSDLDPPLPRYGLLETVREFGIERLAELGEIEAVHTSHADYCLSLVEQLDNANVFLDGGRSIRALPTELDNFRAALRWLDDSGETVALLRLCGRLGMVWLVFSHYPEARTWLERALAKASDARAIHRVKPLIWLGLIDLYQGRDEAAKRLLTQALDAGGDDIDAYDESSILLYLGGLALQKGELDRSVELFEQTVRVADRIEDPQQASVMSGVLKVNLAGPAHARGDDERAIALLDDAARVLHQRGHLDGTMMALTELGNVFRGQGDQQRALGDTRRALELGSATPNTRLLIEVVEAIVSSASLDGFQARAVRLLGASASMRDRIGYRFRDSEAEAALDRVLARIRTAPSAESYDEAWTDGSRMTPPEVRVAALELLDTPESRSNQHAANLTDRELAVLRLLADGLTNPEIGKALFISHRTVDNHVSHILRKLGVATRSAAVTTAIAAGMLTSKTPPSRFPHATDSHT
jgi:DNA-binding NarL/FixJ family response regulator